MTSQTVTPTQTKYNRSTRKWETWRGDYENAKIIGGIIAFPAGRAGKRGALLNALAADHPGVAAEAEALIQKHPPATDYILRAGNIVSQDNVELLHYGHYRVQSQSDPIQSYIVAHFEGQGWHCQCESWRSGHNYHLFTSPIRARASYAPDFPGIGTACKHVLACHMYINIMDVQRCPTCSGRCMEEVELSPVWPTSEAIKLCQDCNATGAVVGQPHVNMNYYNEKVQDFDEFEEYEQIFSSAQTFYDEELPMNEGEFYAEMSEV